MTKQIYKLTPADCVRLLTALGLSIEQIQKETGVGRQRLFRIRNGQDNVDYKAVDALRECVARSKDRIDDIAAKLQNLAGA